MHGFFGHKNLPPKRHLDRFSRVCTGLMFVPNTPTDSHTDHAVCASIAIGHICKPTAWNATLYYVRCDSDYDNNDEDNDDS